MSTWRDYKRRLRWQGSMRKSGGMDDPTPDPEFDQQLNKLNQQEEIRQGIKAITPGVQEQMRARGINEPDWAPLESAIPPEHRGGWMWMGYGPDGIRHYKHGLTRRYLNLMPMEDAKQSSWGHYINRDLYGQHPDQPDVPMSGEHYYGPDPVAFQSHPGALAPHGYVPVKMQDALDHAYEDIDKLIPPGTPGDPRAVRYNDEYRQQRDQRLQDAGYQSISIQPSEPPAVDDNSAG